ncbi:hypothetical protein WJX74_003507 [Apatococcus lobatus]|uniref:Phospholipid/glycerol acyltransferase domain-containing protein n=1 Tax=Apatococcus lobatus TaxID=904363 RepID=A0AAW1RJA9_9CHLO
MRIADCLRSRSSSHLDTHANKLFTFQGRRRSQPAFEQSFQRQQSRRLCCQAYTRSDREASIPDLAPVLDSVQHAAKSRSEKQALQQGVHPVSSKSLFPQSHVAPHGILGYLSFILYFPFGSVISFFRMGLWVALLALDLPWLTASDTGISVLQTLLGLKIQWHGSDLIPAERHVMVSNHVTAGDLMVLYSRPVTYTHLISVSLPPQACRARNHRVKLVQANPESYNHLAEPPCQENVHLFPEGGLTNGKGMMRFSRGFMRFAQDGPVVPVALRASLPWGITTHTLTSSFVANLFWFCFAPSLTLAVTVLPALSRTLDEGNANFVERVQQAIAEELNIPIVDFTVQQKRQQVQQRRHKLRFFLCGDTGLGLTPDDKNSFESTCTTEADPLFQMAEGPHRYYQQSDHKAFYGDAEAYQAMQQGQHIHPHSLQTGGFEAGSFHQHLHHYPSIAPEHGSNQAALQHASDQHMDHQQAAYHAGHLSLAGGSTPPMTNQQSSQRQHHQQLSQQLLQHPQQLSQQPHPNSLPSHTVHHPHAGHALAAQEPNHLQMAQSPLGMQHLQHSTPQQSQPQQSPAGTLPNNSISPAQAMTPPPPGTRFSHATLEGLRAEQAQFVTDREMDRLQSPRNLLFALVTEIGSLSSVFQWRGENIARTLPNFSQTERGSVSDTLSEVLFVLVRLADSCGVDLAAAAQHKFQKNSHKYPADRSRGMSLDHYSRPRMMMKEDSLDPNGGKRKRFTEDQLNALQKLAEEAQWSLVSVPREARDKFCSEWEITKARLHNFFNNRKPKDLKKARSRLLDSAGSQDNNAGEEVHEHQEHEHQEHEHQQADFSNM